MNHDYQKALALLQAATKLLSPNTQQQGEAVASQPVAEASITPPPVVNQTPVEVGHAIPQVGQPVSTPSPAGRSPAIPVIPQMQGLPPSAPQATATLSLDQLASMTPDQINQNWSQVQALVNANSSTLQ